MNDNVKIAFSIASAFSLVGLFGIVMVLICPEGLSRDQIAGITMSFIIFDLGIGIFTSFSIYSWLNYKFPEVKQNDTLHD